MAGPDQTRRITDWRVASRFYRRSPGPGWLAALIAIPLLLGLIGWGTLDRSHRSTALTTPSVDPSVTLNPTSAAVAVPPKVQIAPLSLVRNGNDVTLIGVVPDDGARAALVDRVKNLLPGVNVIDHLTLTHGAVAADPAALDGVLRAGAAIPDFGLNIDGSTVTLTGTAPSDEVKAQVESAVKAAWPDLAVVNNITVAGPAPETGPSCATLQADIASLLATPINFDTNGSAVAPSSVQLIASIADKLKGCPNASAAVTGHTDNTGNDVINAPLSASRAKAVADALVSDGVAADKVTSKGVGSADPVATNDTESGRAQNRRVQITVS